MRETKYSQKLYKVIRKLNLDKEETGQLLVCLYINGCSLEDCAKLFGADEEKVVKFLESEKLNGCQVCSKCDKLRDRKNEFRQRNNQKLKTCRFCEKEYEKEYQKNNKEKKKEYYENNKEEMKEYGRKYYEDNKEDRNQYGRKYYEDNKEQIKEYSKKYKNSEASVEYVQKLAMCEKVSGNQIRCKYCGKWITPTSMQVQSRLKGIEDNDKHHIYCSEGCKQECPIFHQKKYPKGFTPASSREVNPVLRQIVFERDDYTCQKCGEYENVRLHCHHIIPVVNSPIEANDPENCNTLCKDCHNIVHKIPGCTYQELKCG